MRGFDKNIRGALEATIRNISDPNIVVMNALRRPVLKKLCNPAFTLKMVSPFTIATLLTSNEVMRATMN